MNKAKQRYRILVSYYGGPYYGWQRQKNHQTVQGTIEQALKQILGQDVPILGAGRTDTGAHALGQSAHFSALPSPRIPLKKSLNAVLVPKGICVRRIWHAPPGFHAQRSAIGKSYKYLVLNRETPCVFRKGRIYWHSCPLDIQRLNQMSQQLKGRHNFKSFQNSGSVVRSPVRNIFSAYWTKKAGGNLIFHIKGEGFLKQMIRNIVGTQLKIEREPNFLQKWTSILQAKDRSSAGICAPAKGLYLCQVYYPLRLDKQCVEL